MPVNQNNFKKETKNVSITEEILTYDKSILLDLDGDDVKKKENALRSLVENWYKDTERNSPENQLLKNVFGDSKKPLSEEEKAKKYAELEKAEKVASVVKVKISVVEEENDV